MLPAAALAACGSAPPSAPPISPADVLAVHSELPAGYETGELHGPISAAALWGFGQGWTAEPPECAALADPAPKDTAARGFSASGPGGTVFVMAATAPSGRLASDLMSECGHWTMHYGHTNAEVVRTQAPAIDQASTFCWQAEARTLVESGNPTITKASTAVAYLERFVVVVTVVTDPGSPNRPLDAGFADALLTAAVATLRVH